MTRLAVFLTILLSVRACGGAVEKSGNQGASSGGSSSGGASPTGTTFEVIDDMDNAGGGFSVPAGSSSFAWRGGLGNWFVTSSDGVTRDATIEEIDPAQADGGRACHVSSQGEGVDLWAQLNHPLGNAVDLRPYAGIAFKARLSGAGGPLIVAFGANGRFFVESTDFHQQTVGASDEWNSFELLFAELGLETTATSSIDFIVGAARAPFDLWVDDLAFLCQGTCP